MLKYTSKMMITIKCEFKMHMKMFEDDKDGRI